MVVIIPFIVTFAAIILKWKGAQIRRYFPRYTISFESDNNSLNSPNKPLEYANPLKYVPKKNPRLYVTNNTDNPLPSDYRFYFSTPTHYRLVELPLYQKENFTKSKGGREGPWFPYDIVRQRYASIFSNIILDKTVVWKLRHFDGTYWHCNYECFDWNDNQWVSRNWNGIYIEGIFANLMLIGSWRNKAKKQIKIWKKDAEKKKKEQMRKIVL